MKQSNTKSIGRVMLEYSVFAPVLATLFQCGAAFGAVVANPLPGLLLTIGVYIALALFHLRTQKAPLATHSISFYQIAIFCFTILFLIAVGIFIYFPASSPSEFEESPIFIPPRAFATFLSAYVFGLMSGLITIFVTQIIRVRRLQQDDPFEPD